MEKFFEKKVLIIDVKIGNLFMINLFSNYVISYVDMCKEMSRL